MARREMGVVRRRPEAHVSPAAEDRLVRRCAVHLRRRGVLAGGCARPQGEERRRRGNGRRRTANPGGRAKRDHGRFHLCRPRRSGCAACSTCCPSCRSTSWPARSRPERWARCGDRRRRRPISSAWARSCCVNTRRDSGWSWTAIPATGEPARTGSRCRIWIASSSRSCRTRTRSSCASRPAAPT